MVHWVWGWGAEYNGIISVWGRKSSQEVEMGQYAPAEDLTVTLQSHVGIISFMDFLSSQFVILSSEHVR